MKILVIYTNTEIVSAQEIIENEVAAVSSPENFFCGDKEDIIAFFELKGFDTSIIENL